jgi:hypothetical protein
MGLSLTSVPFFTDTIKIKAHTATHAQHLRSITLREFSRGRPISLKRIEETGEYFAQIVEHGRDGDFIQGPEDTSPPVKYFRLYAKFPNSRRFQPMDCKACRPVINLIYATIFEEEPAQRVLAEVTRMNPDVKFELRPTE